MNKFFFKKKKYGVANDSMRFLAFFFDLMLFNVITLGGGFLYFLFRGQIKSHVLAYIDDIVNVYGYGKLRTDWFNLEVKLFMLYIIYSIVMELFSKKGSLGKRFMKIEFEKKGAWYCVVMRNLIKPLSIAGWPIAIIVAKRSPERQWPHDLVCKKNILKIK